MKEIIKDIINGINIVAVIFGIIEALVGAILIRTTIGISAILLILGGMNIGKRIIWWKGVVKVKENIEEDIIKIEKYIELVLEKDYCNCNELNTILGKHCDGSKNVAYAITHILSDYKRVLKENEELKKFITEGITIEPNSPYKNYQLDFLRKNFIPKQSVKDKIEELNNNKENYTFYEITSEDIRRTVITNLQELIESEGKR